jgi:Fe-S cluster assembly iron-binding protein IscA
VNMTISPRASEELQKAVTNDEASSGLTSVRVMVQGQCGCGNAHFQMGFDEPEEEDSRIDLGDFTLLADPYTAPLLEGAEMVYIESEDLTKRGFKINTVSRGGGGGCGCGGGHGHNH